MSEDSKAWSLLEKLVMDSHKEQKKAKSWSLLFKTLTFTYIGVVLFIVLTSIKLPSINIPFVEAESEGYVSSINIKGPIADGTEADADFLMKGLQRAFKDKQSKAILLKINSPGGSPVQSGYVYDEIKRLRAEHPEKKVYAVIEDLGASGAYYIAAAADKIYADKASLVGSIGVISSSFGFVEAMEKIGVERRAYHAGDNKALLDPFSPQDSQQTEFWQGVLNTTHQQFIAQVKAGRGDRLKLDNPDLFSGLIWTGEQALALGLIDGLGSAETVAEIEAGTRDIVNASVFHYDSVFEEALDLLGVSLGKGITQSLGLDNKQSLELR